MLYTYDINRILSENCYTKRKFKGVFPIDEIGKLKFSRPAIIIVNTDPSYMDGTHWFVISVNTRKSCTEIFDSYGRKLMSRSIKKFVKQNSNGKIKYNEKELQHPKSTVCGQYCCVFTLYKSFGYSMKEFVSQFDHRRTKNDQYIKKLFKLFFK